MVLQFSVDALAERASLSHHSTTPRQPFEPLISERVSQRLALGDPGIAIVHTSGALRAAIPAAAEYRLLIPSSGVGELEQYGVTSALAAGESMGVVSPMVPATLTQSEAYRGFQVSISTSVLRAACHLAFGRGEELPHFDVGIDTRRGPGAIVLRQFRMLLGELEQEHSAFDEPLITRRLVDAFAMTVVAKLARERATSGNHRPGAGVPDYVLRVERYLQQNAAECLELSELAGIAGVSVRTIQAGFKAHRTYTPTQYLRECRYELARQMLSERRAESITSVAHRCGFEHLGRFSTGYRARFGENPRATLQRAAHDSSYPVASLPPPALDPSGDKARS